MERENSFGRNEDREKELAGKSKKRSIAGQIIDPEMRKRLPKPIFVLYWVLTH